MKCLGCGEERETYSIKIVYPYGAISSNGMEVVVRLCNLCAENMYTFIKEFSGMGYLRDVGDLNKELE